jgi:hypothetical protein
MESRLWRLNCCGIIILKGRRPDLISAWGSAPGLNRNNESRAESPIHASFETVSLLPPLRVCLIIVCSPRRKQASRQKSGSKLPHSKCRALGQRYRFVYYKPLGLNKYFSRCLSSFQRLVRTSCVFERVGFIDVKLQAFFGNPL